MGTMLRPRLLLVLTLLTAVLAVGRARADCKVEAFTLPVTMTDLRATVPAKINGAPVELAIDSGAFYSIIPPSKAAEAHLKIEPLPFVTAQAIGGDIALSATTVKDFVLAGAQLHNIQFIVGGGALGHDVAGLLGQNVLGFYDVEYDLADGAVRIMHPRGCMGRQFAYWTKGAPFSVIPIDTDAGSGVLAGVKATKAFATVNGVRIHVQFDTGAPHPMLTLAAARRAGVDASTMTRTENGGGLGRRTYAMWIAPVDSFGIGDEQVRHTRLRIADTSIGEDVDMLVGADFFLSHRLYVANSQNRLYFTYNGGPVFDLTTRPQAVAAAGPQGASPSPGPDTPPPPAAPDAAGAVEPRDAEGFSRRGVAYAARREFAAALADLTHACDLAPGEARYFRQRGQVYLQNRQPFLAMADFDRALKLKPDDAPTLMARAEMKLTGHDTAGALADLDAVDAAASPEADVRLPLAAQFERADALPRAITQYGLWLKAHPLDNNEARYHALNRRCWSRALLNQDLDAALADCDAAVRMNPRAAAALDSRGLVQLRRGAFDKAIADYDAALAIQPHIAWSLYGRGIARRRTGQTALGDADIAAAKAVRPDLPALAAAHGLAP